MKLLKSHPILSIANSFVIDSPSPSNLSYLWNYGSLLGTCLIIQIITGVTLSMHYSANVDLAFMSVEHIYQLGTLNLLGGTGALCVIIVFNRGRYLPVSLSLKYSLLFWLFYGLFLSYENHPITLFFTGLFLHIMGFSTFDGF
jgi:uncharacterized membrane protein YdcZ (DUF606 family)